MAVTPFGMTTLVRLEQFQNASSSMTVTLSGMTRLVRLEDFLNAPFPMAITGIPSMLSGMRRSAAFPLYL
jgi:hypothetical protein